MATKCSSCEGVYFYSIRKCYSNEFWSLNRICILCRTKDHLFNGSISAFSSKEYIILASFPSFYFSTIICKQMEKLEVDMLVYSLFYACCVSEILKINIILRLQNKWNVVPVLHMSDYLNRYNMEWNLASNFQPLKFGK